MTSITDNSFAERLVAFCDKAIAFFGWDIDRLKEDVADKRTIYMQRSDGLRAAVYKAKMEAEVNYGLGITSLYESIPSSESYSIGFSNLLVFSDVKHYELWKVKADIELIDLIRELITLYDDWKVEYEETIANISSNAMFDKKDEAYVDPSVLQAINELVFNGGFKTYKYRDTGEVLHPNDKFFISTEIGFSSDLQLWFDHLQKQKEFLATKPKNEVYVTLFGKLDEVHPLYSSWLVTLHKGDTIWIASDQLTFDNPFQKHARLGRKSVWRQREAVKELCDLPYDLFEDLDVIRAMQGASVVKNDWYLRLPKKYFSKVTNTSAGDEFWEEEIHWRKEWSSALEKQGVSFDAVDFNRGTLDRLKTCIARKNGRTVAVWNCEDDFVTVYLRPEFMFMKTSELEAQQKTFLVLLTKELINHCHLLNDTYKTIMLGGEYLEQKKLEGASLNPSGESSIGGWGKSRKKEFFDLLETAEVSFGKTDALAVKDYGLAVHNGAYEASWLAVPDQQHSLIEWSLLETERIKIDEKVRQLGKNSREQREELTDMLHKKFDLIRDKVAAYKKVEFHVQTEGYDGEPYIYLSGTIKPEDVSGVDKYRGWGVGKARSTWSDDSCLCANCNKNKAYVQSRIVFKHYREMMWLMGLESRTLLPKYFQNYNTNGFRGGGGNNLLQQEHPFLRISDPASRRGSVQVDIYMCGRCAKKLQTEDRTLYLLIDGDTVREFDGKKPL